MLQRKGFPFFSLALLVAVAASQALAFALTTESLSVLAQTPATSPVPTPFAVPEGARVTVDGSESLSVLDEALKQRYEASFPGTVVDLSTSGSEAALQALREGELDIASLGRVLTEAEKAEGLQEIRLPREKIAIIVGPDNPFQSNLTFEQFARIFRGEITNWSQLGGPSQPVRFVDRPDSSDTRLAISQYGIWQELGGFTPGADVEPVGEDSTDAVVQSLGADGIGYAAYSKVRDRSDVRILSMHQTLPDNPAYPYSQPRVLVHKGNLSPASQAFLALATGATVVAANPGAGTAVGVTAASPDATGSAATDPAAASDATAPAKTDSPATDSVTAADPATPAATAEDATAPANASWDRWALLALLLLGLLPFLLKFLRRSPAAAPPAAPPNWAQRAAGGPIASPANVPPPPLPPDAGSPGVGTVAGGAAALGGAATAAGSPAAVGGTAAAGGGDRSGLPVGAIAAGAAALGGVAAMAGLAAGGRKSSRIVLAPRDQQTGYAYWEAPEDHRQELRAQGGRDLKLRVYDVTGIANPETSNLNGVVNGQVQDYGIKEMDQDRHLPLQPDRDYLAEVGYATETGEWLALARSNPIRLSQAVGLAGFPAVASPAPSGLGAAVAGLGAVAGAALVGGAIARNVDRQAETPDSDPQSDVEAAKYDVGQTDLSAESLADVDAGLADLPTGYGQSTIVLLPRDPQWAYTYWDTPNEHKEALRRQGGQRLALRLYDVTDIGDPDQQRPHSLLEYDCDEMARDWYLGIPVSDRDYLVEIGYLTPEGYWLMLARSNRIRIPPVYPSDWYEEHFLSVDWDESLRGKTLFQLNPPGAATERNPLYAAIFDQAQSAEASRVAGSLFGSMHQVPTTAFGSAQMASGQAIESFPAGSFVPYETSGSYTAYGAVSSYTAYGTVSSYVSQSAVSSYITQSAVSSFITQSGVGMMGIGMGMGAVPTFSGIGMSGVGFFASMPPLRARKFWLVADAELIVYGATEPDATVYINGEPIQLASDGTFRFHMSFPDGLIDFPILAIAADGEQTRAIHMKFNRETPHRYTNTKDEARDEPY